MQPVSIVPAATARDRRRALGYVRRHVRRLYGGIPPPSQILLFAERKHRICGTIALDFAEASGKFPVEDIYRIDYARTPWPFERERIAQFGKWWVSAPGVAVRLMHAAHLHALTKGKSVGLVEAKVRIVERVKDFGMTLILVPGAVLQVQGVSARGEGYYASLPLPRLYMFDIRANVAVLARYVSLRGC